MNKQTAPATPVDDTIEFSATDEPSGPMPSTAGGQRRPTRAVLAAGAVASALAATAAYRRRRAQK